MLIRFRVGNFLSFNDNQEFSMIAGKTRNYSDRLYKDDSLKLIKFAAFYGANASGKSNLIKAIDFARVTILREIPSKSIISYSKINNDNKNKNSYFEFEIELNGKYYAYGFEILLSERAIKKEWLYELFSSKEDKLIFARDIENKSYEISDKYFKTKKLYNNLIVFIDVIKEDSSVLFLHDINEKKVSLYNEFPEVQILKTIYNWFYKDLDVNYANRPLKDSYRNIFDENISCKIQKYLNMFGIGITKVVPHPVSREEIKESLPQFVIDDIIEELKKDNNKIPKKKILLNFSLKGFYLFEKNQNDEITYKVLNFNHGDDDIAFLLSEESDGTQRLMELLSVLIIEEEGKIFIIDEIDRCLHPLLTKKFISSFLEIAKKKNIQLIVTTHESQLMDLNLLRKDEIWLINKDKYGESTIYSLDEFNERFDKKIVRAYLDGRYGAIPEFDKNINYGEISED